MPSRTRPVPARLALVATLAALLAMAGGPGPAVAAGGGRTTAGRTARGENQRAGSRAKARRSKRRSRVKNPRGKRARSQLRFGHEQLGVVVHADANPVEHLPAAKGERIVFGVMGGAGSGTARRTNTLVRQLGRHIAEAGHVVLTGAAPGLPDEAARGAKSKGGLTIGISPWSNLSDHLKSGAPTNFDVLQTTELPAALRGQGVRPNYMGREIDNIERSDVIVVAGGRFGTLGELAIALEEQRPVGVLLGTGGISDQVKNIVKASTEAGKPPGAPVVYDTDPKRLVQKLIEAKRQMDRAGGHRGPLGER